MEKFYSVSIKNVAVCIIILLTLFLATCIKTDVSNADLVISVTDVFMYTPDTSGLKIMWKDASTAADSITKYNIYFHTNADSNWQLIKTVDKTNSPSTIVRRDEIPSDSSVLYFGVANVGKGEKSSDIHTSSDASAYSKKWVVNWPPN